MRSGLGDLFHKIIDKATYEVIHIYKEVVNKLPTQDKVGRGSGTIRMLCC